MVEIPVNRSNVTDKEAFVKAIATLRELERRYVRMKTTRFCIDTVEADISYGMDPSQLVQRPARKSK